MGPEIEPQPESKPTMEAVSTGKENGSAVDVAVCATNSEAPVLAEGNSLGGETMAEDRCEDMEVNVTECTRSPERDVGDADRDATENSSSFADTASGPENGSALSDAEVESPMQGGGLEMAFGGCDGQFQMRKKKLTDHWRRFIRPLMWRCKWVELQLRELKSQSQKYDRELAAYDLTKQLGLEKFIVEGVDAKSLPFSCQIPRTKVMTRKKRKRVEETTDIASYILQHKIFSYNDSRKPFTASTALYDGCGYVDKKTNSVKSELGFTDGWTSFEFKDGDSSLEQILLKIEVVQSQVRGLKSRIDKVVSENPQKFSSINQLSLPARCDVPTNSGSHASDPESGDRMPVKSLCSSLQQISEYKMGGLFVPGSVVSSHGEVMPLPDMIESTGQHQTGEEILINNEAAKEELRNFGSVISHLEDKPQTQVQRPQKPEVVSPAPAPGDKLAIDSSMASVKPTPRLPPASKSKVYTRKRRRGKRKSVSVSWKSSE